jgi:protein-S-isoprenylcysteine O-methyltransferase Ste14
MFLKYFLPLFLTAYVAVAFVWRSYAVRKATGINPVVFKNSDSAHDLIGQLFKLLFTSIALVVVIYSFFPTIYKFTVPIPWLELVAMQWAGVGLLGLSLIWTVIAQYQMGDSWRIGIDQDHTTLLVHRGLFRISRNPIFVGMITTLLGLFLVIPNAVTLVILVTGVAVIAIQVRLEEAYLFELHGDDYAKYRRRVRRWL